MSDNNNDLTRRDFLIWAAAAASLLTLQGCGYAPQAYVPPARTPMRPAANSFNSKDTAYASPMMEEPPVTYVLPEPQPAPIVQAAPAKTPARTAQVVRPSTGKVSAMSRNTWGATAATPSKMKAMNGVSRITIHHEGSAKPNNDTTPAQVAATLRLIQSQHRKRMGAGDIGYHFIIDRTGTIWQGRDWNYQGAHTSGANSNNIGIMLLGNFEIQQPTSQQLNSLNLLTASLLRKFRLSGKDIYGHSDFCNTQCPGKHLKPTVMNMRRTLR